jgi:hypothetical protein
LTVCLARAIWFVLLTGSFALSKSPNVHRCGVSTESMVYDQSVWVGAGRAATRSTRLEQCGGTQVETFTFTDRLKAFVCLPLVKKPGGWQHIQPHADRFLSSSASSPSPPLAYITQPPEGGWPSVNVLSSDMTVTTSPSFLDLLLRCCHIPRRLGPRRSFLFFCFLRVLSFIFFPIIPQLRINCGISTARARPTRSRPGRRQGE